AGEGQNERLFRHLDHFIIGEDVTLTDRTAELAQLHLAGPRAAEVLNGAVGWMPPAGWPPHSFAAVQLSRATTLVVRQSALVGVPGLDLLYPCDTARQWVRDRLLFRGARLAGREAYEALRVENGVPEYGLDVDETTFAPEVGRADAISYQK